MVFEILNGMSWDINHIKTTVSNNNNDEFGIHEEFPGDFISFLRLPDKLWGLNNIQSLNLLSHSSEGWSYKIKVSAGLIPSQSCEEESVSCLSPSFCWFAGSLWCSLA